jgi:hypothetical protein
MMQLPELKQRGAEAVGSRAGLKRGVNWSQARRSFERQPIKRVDEAMPLQRPSCAHGSQNDEQIPPFPDVKPALKATRLAVARHSGVLTVRRLLEHALVYAGCSPRLLWKLMKDVARSAERKAGRPYAELAPRWAPHPVDFQGPFFETPVGIVRTVLKFLLDVKFPVWIPLPGGSARAAWPARRCEGTSSPWRRRCWCSRPSSRTARCATRSRYDGVSALWI